MALELFLQLLRETYLENLQNNQISVTSVKNTFKGTIQKLQVDEKRLKIQHYQN